MGKMLTRKAFLFFLCLTTFLLSAYPSQSFVWSTRDGLKAPLVAVVVDSGIYDDIQSSLQQYVEDVEKSGYVLRMVRTSDLVNETKEGIRDYLYRLLNESLVGAVLIGDVPTAWYEVDSNRFPTDAYYMDLDIQWIDSDGNGVYDRHDMDLAPQIWIGRIKPPEGRGDSAHLLNRYFEKNHLYRNGLISVPWWRALLYMDDQGLVIPHPQANPLSVLGCIATEIVAVNDTRTQETNSEDYKEKLQDETGYHWLYLMCHGTATNHTFLVSSKEDLYRRDGTVYSSDYETLDPRVFFYHLFVCSAGNFVEPDYLAGSAVFANNYGLLAIASTYSAYTFPFNVFYEALSKGSDIGTSFLHWLRNAIVERAESHWIFPNDDNYEILLLDTVMVGDPTLRLYREKHDVALTGLTAFMNNISGVESLEIAFKVENIGDFTETFSVTVLLDSEAVYSTELTLAPRKNETVAFHVNDSAKYVWGSIAQHTASARISPLVGEFETNNNFRSTLFYGNVLFKYSPRQLPDAVFAAIGFFILGSMSFGFTKILVSDRPLYGMRKRVLRFVTRVRGEAFKHAEN